MGELITETPWYRIADKAIEIEKQCAQDGASAAQQRAAVASLLESKTGISNPVKLTVEMRAALAHLRGLAADVNELLDSIERSLGAA